VNIKLQSATRPTHAARRTQTCKERVHSPALKTEEPVAGNTWDVCESTRELFLFMTGQLKERQFDITKINDIYLYK